MGLFLVGVEERYPKEILTGRVPVEGNVVSCLLKDPTLLDDNKNLDNSFFLTKDGLFYFSLVKFLREKKYNAIDEVTILSNCSEEYINKYKDLGGFDEIQHMTDIVDTKNFDAYLDVLYRENTICRLYKDGFNLFTKQTNSKGHEFTPIELFRKMPNDQVMDWYDAKLSSYETSSSSKIIEEGSIGFSDAFLEECCEGTENGVPFDCAGVNLKGRKMMVSPFLSKQILGFRDGTLSMMAGYSSTGKSSWWVGVLFALLSQGRHILVISNEERKSVFETRFLVYLVWKYCGYGKLTKKNMMAGNLTDEDRNQIKIARDYWNKNFANKLEFVAVTEMDMTVNKKLIRNYVRRKGVDTVLLDTFKIDFNNTSESRTDLDLVRDSRDLDSLAKKYNIIMLASLQLAMNSKGVLFLTSNQLSNSKQIVEVTENLLMMRNAYKEELDPNNKKFFCYPYRMEVNEETGEWEKKPFKPDKDKVYRILFFSKTRTGANSEDTGKAFLLEYQGDHVLFTEKAWCTPQHGLIQ